MILVTGGNGSLGSYIDFGVKTDQAELDVTDKDACRKYFEENNIETVVHLAALTDLGVCEKEPDLAYKINSIGTYNIALSAKKAGARFIYISTNAVFDGEKEGPYLPHDTPKPINIYGHSKYLGELIVLGLNPQNLVVRTSWIFGGGPEKDKKFVAKILPKLAAREPLEAVDDVRGTPTYAKDLAEKLKNLIEENKSGIIHCVNSGRASRHDMAELIKEAIGSQSEIKAKPLSSFGNLSNTLMNEALDPGEQALRPWQEALREYVGSEWKNYV